MKANLICIKNKELIDKYYDLGVSIENIEPEIEIYGVLYFRISSVDAFCLSDDCNCINLFIRGEKFTVERTNNLYILLKKSIEDD